MDVVIEDLMRKFQADRGLSGLSNDQLFETFAAYCVLGQFHEDDFDPDRLRMGGSRDLGIDAAAVVINSVMYTDADDVRQYVAGSKDLRVHFVVVQAKVMDSFQADVFTQLATNLQQVFGAGDLTFNASEKVKNFRACVQAVYAEPKKLTSEKPQLSVWYATCGTHRMPPCWDLGRSPRPITCDRSTDSGPYSSAPSGPVASRSCISGPLKRCRSP